MPQEGIEPPTGGLWAPVLLCILRLTQGLAVGGEWGGAAIIAVENAPKGRRGFFGSWPQIGVSCGLLLGTGAVTLAQAISGDQFNVWGWRVPFLVSVVLAAVGLYIRLNASESPAFLAAKAEAERKQEHQKAQIPVVFEHHRKPLVISLFLRFAKAGNYYLFNVFLLSYVATTLKLPASYGLVAVMIGSALNIVMILVFGAVSARIGRKNTFFFGAAVIIVSAWPIFSMIQTGNPFAIIAGVAIFLTLGHAAVYSVLRPSTVSYFQRKSATPVSPSANRSQPSSWPASPPSSPVPLSSGPAAPGRWWPSSS